MPARISLLLPTWGRPEELRRTLADVLSTVARPELLEVLLYVQDGPTAELLDSGELRCSGVIADAPCGYRGLPVAINALAERASGDWLFVFADDVGCDTAGWDDVIRRYDHAAPLLLTCQNNRGNRDWFPIISRAAYERLGLVTASQFHDVWLAEIFDRARPGSIHRGIPAQFTDRLVCSDTLGGLSDAERLAYRASIEDAVLRLREVVA